MDLGFFKSINQNVISDILTTLSPRLRTTQGSKAVCPTSTVRPRDEGVISNTGRAVAPVAPAAPVTVATGSSSIQAPRRCSTADVHEYPAHRIKY